MLNLVIALLVAAPNETPPGVCVIDGTVKNVDKAQMLALDALTPLFDATLHDAKVQATLEVGAEQVTLQGAAGIRYRARIAKAALPVRVKRTTTVAGVLTLSPKTPLEVQFTIDGDVALRARPFRASIGPFRLPCSALTLGDALPDPSDMKVPPVPRRYVTTARTFSIHAKDPLDVALDEGTTLVVERLATRDAESEIRASWKDGTALRGLVPSAVITASDGEIGPSLGMLHGMCGFGVSDTYVGPATLKVGALIYDASEGGTAWGEVVKATKVEVIGDWGRVEITLVPGVVDSVGCVRTNKAWADAGLMTYPRH